MAKLRIWDDSHWGAVQLQSNTRLPGKQSKENFSHKVFVTKFFQSNFFSTVIFNFDYVFFFGIYCHFIEIGSLHWVSATKETFSWSQKRSKNTLFVTNQWFLCRTDSLRRTSFKEMAKNAKKKDMVQIEHHCTKKTRLGYLRLKKGHQIGHYFS